MTENVFSEFNYEFYSEVDDIDDRVKEEVEDTLRALAEGRQDMIGASVAVEELASGETTYLYQARIVVYIKPKNIAAVEKGEKVTTALKGALNAVERQVRELRDKKGKPWEKPGSSPEDQV
jgi:ribosome-associated translation inhibitor RaiA